MVQQLLSVGLALSSIWEKARAKDRQREVVGDKGQWALFCKGWDQLREQGVGTGKGRWREIRDSGLCSAREETSCSLGCRRGSSYHSPIFCFLKREGEEKCWVLGRNLILWLLPAGGGGTCSQVGSLGFGVFVGVSVGVPLVALKRLLSLEEELIESLVGGCRYAI
jgi:hypothetical protein